MLENSRMVCVHTRFLYTVPLAGKERKGGCGGKFLSTEERERETIYISCHSKIVVVTTSGEVKVLDQGKKKSAKFSPKITS